VNLFAARVVLRPRALTEVLDLSAPFCLHNARLIGRLSLGALVPLVALAAGLRLGLRWSWLAVWAALLPASWLVEGVFTVGLGEALFRDPAAVTGRAVAGRFLRAVPALVAVHAARLVVLGGGALLVLPLFFELPRWLFPVEAVLLENARAGAAVTRSRALGRRRTAFCLGLALALGALPVLAAMLADVLGRSLFEFVFQLGRPAGSLFDDGGSGFAVLGLLLSVPLSAAMRFLGYIDLRTRSEGWDIQLRFAAWAERERGRGGGDPGRWAA
jgi:hypothetical protein